MILFFLNSKISIYWKQDSEETVGELIPTLKIDLLFLKTTVYIYPPMIIKYVLYESSEIQKWFYKITCHLTTQI